jgi:hemoglobin-like flavoprotein
MTPEQLDLVRSSYASLGDGATAMARDFYRRLFAADPGTEALFSPDARADIMAGKFAEELAAILQAIVSFEAFVPRVRELATRHVGYGVRTGHYRAVGDALLAALAVALGDRWDAELEAAWRRAYNLVAEVMMSAASSTPAAR